MGSQEEDIDKLISELEDLVKLEDAKPLTGSGSIKIKKGNKILPIDLQEKEKVSKNLTSIYEEWLQQED